MCNGKVDKIQLSMCIYSIYVVVLSDQIQIVFVHVFFFFAYCHIFPKKYNINYNL